MQVIAAIARREIVVALRRRLVKLLFLANLMPPIIMAVILVVTMLARKAGLVDLGWDPLLRLLEIQVGPVLLLALGIGTPLIARDRSEEVLFLYATRPVTPWSYTLGKMIAVALPAAALLIVPGILICILRQGLIEDFGTMDSLSLMGKVVLVAVLMAWGYAGVSVGPSAATKKARWALLLAFLGISIPNVVSQIIWGNGGYALDAAHAVEDLLYTLIEGGLTTYGVVGAVTLVVWGSLGALVTATRVRREMTP